MIKNTAFTLNCMHKLLSANSIGIWKNTKVSTRVRSEYMPKFFCNTASYTSFEKNVFSMDLDISYHLTGYGLLKNETFIRFMGESAERFTFASIHKLLGERIICAAYSELIKIEDSLVIPLEYINIYPEMNIDENTILQWVKMNSFQEEFTYVYIPAALVIMGWEMIGNEKETMDIKSVSTGTACHQTVEKALENSIIEYLQLDSANLWWQSGIKGKKIDKDIVNHILDKMQLSDRFFEKFQINVTDISFDKPIYILVCEITSKDLGLPQYAIGIQGGLNLEESLYRGIMEALTILEYAYNYKFINEENYLKITENKCNDFFDLDTNVIFYSKYGMKQRNRIEFKSWVDKKVITTRELINQVTLNYKYAGFLDISNNDFKSLGFHMTRVIIPELIPLYLPSLIPTLHSRFKLYEVKNYDPHPMP